MNTVNQMEHAIFKTKSTKNKKKNKNFFLSLQHINLRFCYNYIERENKRNIKLWLVKDYSQRVIDFECAKPYLKDLEHQICIAAFNTFIFLYLTQQNSRNTYFNVYIEWQS